MGMGKRIIVVVFALTLCLTCFTSCSSGSKEDSGNAETFTWWNGNGEDSSYYPDYSENPVINYITNYKTWGPDDKKIQLDFHIPAAGTQQEACVTMIGTGDYMDVIDMSYYTSVGSVAELYEDGIAMDLTPYVEQYMPNYQKFLDEHPHYARTATNYVDGESRYLQLYIYHDSIEQWGGYMYRRDWIVKYGTNPETGQSFTGGYGAPGDPDSWTDDVVFPSGGPDPFYISDWEWMFDIFTKALRAEGITDGYCVSLPYQGYNETGDLLCAFGGGGGGWYLNGDTVEFGGNSDQMRAYLECVSNWYRKGWVDKSFAEHTSDMFFRIDSTKLRQGKVGLEYESVGILGSNLDISDGKPDSPGNGYTNGICMYPCRQPINDIYGTAAEQNKDPYCMYQVSLEYQSYVVTDKAKDKDLPALFSILDYMYSDEGATLCTFGLNKEQYEETQDPFYTKVGLTDGAYTVADTDNGPKCKFVDKLVSDTNLANAARGNRFFGLQNHEKEYIVRDKINLHALEEWTHYINTGFFRASFNSQRTPEENATYSKILTNVREFMQKNIPNFINGKHDPNNDDEWNAYCNAIAKYKPGTNTQLMQGIYDKLSQ